MIVAMTLPSVAAVVPVYNRATAVTEALSSIESQTRPPSKLIVVDDGSTDTTADRVSSWIESAPRSIDTQLVRQPNRGAAAARNRGIDAAADIDLIAFLDSDDLWPPDYLQRATEALAASEDAVAASSDWADMDDQGRRRRIVQLNDITEQTTQKFFLEHRPKISGTVCRRWALEKVGGFEAASQPGEAHQLLLRLSLLGPWLHAPGEPISYRSVGGGDDGHYSSKYAQRLLIRAQLCDNLIRREGGDRAVPASMWRPQLARMWYRAGRRAVKQGDTEAARRCFANAVELRPLHLKGLWWRLRMAMRS